MDLSTKYLGLKLRTPLVPAASPLSEEIDGIKQMEDAGASAVVLYSLFEEQLRQDRAELDHHMEHGTESFAEALTYFPEPEEFRLGPEEYLKHIAKAKQAVRIPIIASLNGSSVGGWTEYAKAIQQAGADALELNIYYIPTDMDLTSAQIEQTYLDISQGGQVRGHHPGRGEAQPVLHQLRQHGQAPGPGRRERPGAVQPLLPAGHRPRGARSEARTSC